MTNLKLGTRQIAQPTTHVSLAMPPWDVPAPPEPEPCDQAPTWPVLGVTSWKRLADEVRANGYRDKRTGKHVACRSGGGRA
jgi:hypothetical protein